MNFKDVKFTLFDVVWSSPPPPRSPPAGSAQPAPSAPAGPGGEPPPVGTGPSGRRGPASDVRRSGARRHGDPTAVLPHGPRLPPSVQRAVVRGDASPWKRHRVVVMDAQFTTPINTLIPPLQTHGFAGRRKKVFKRGAPGCLDIYNEPNPLAFFPLVSVII